MASPNFRKTSDMITIDRVSIDGFKSIARVEFSLSDVTALIGLNDVGKSNVLQSLNLLGALSRKELKPALEPFGGLEECSFLRNHADGVRLYVHGHMDVEGHDREWEYSIRVVQKVRELPPLVDVEKLHIHGWYNLSRNDTELKLRLSRGEGLEQSNRSADRRWTLMGMLSIASQLNQGDPLLGSLFQEPLFNLQRALANLRVYRFRPEVLATPSPSSSRPELAVDGSGLAAVIEELVADPELRSRFGRIRDALRQHVPYVQDIGVRPVDEVNGQVRKGIHFLVKTGGQEWTFDGRRASDGLLLLLGYLVLLEGPLTVPLLLMEEPENGVHTSRLGFLIQAIRESARRSGRKVLMTTHSPYLLDALQPEEVLLVTRDDTSGATRVSRMDEFAELETWRKGFTLGEIWSNLGEDRLTARG